MRSSSIRTCAILCLAALLGSSCSRETKLERSLSRADEYFRSAKYEAAVIEYQNVLQLEPKHIAALHRLGRIWLDRGAPMRALPYLQQARALAPDNRETLLQEVQLALAGGKVDDARQGAIALLARQPNHAEALTILTELVRGEENLKFAQQTLQTFPNQGSAGFHRAAANLALHQGDIAGAKRALQRAVESEPKSADAHLALGNFHGSMNDKAAAEQHLKQAFDLAPVQSNARLKYFEFKAQTGSVAEAVDGLEKLVQQAPDYFPAWRSLARIAALQGKHDEAHVYLEKIFARDPWNLEARVLRARIRLAKGEVPVAIGELEHLAQKFPDLAGPQFELGRAHLQNKDVRQAKLALENALRLNSDHDAAVLLWGGVALRLGEAQAVVLAMGDLLSKRPGLEAAQMMLIDALGALGRHDDIIAIIRESLRLSPQRAQTHHLLGLVLARKGKLAEARQGFEKALELAPDSFPTVAEVVRLDLREGKLAAAEERAKQQLLKNPQSGAAHLLTASVLAVQKRWDETEAAAWKAIELGSGGLDAHELIVKSYVARNDGPGVHDRLEKLIASRPDNVSALVVAGGVYTQLKEYATAANAYEKCLSINPGIISALNNLACLYSDHLSDPDRAMELASKARQLDPNSPEVADTLGWILFNRKEYSRALELLTESAARLPGNPEVQFHFARASQMMGNFEPARIAFQKAAASSVDFKGKLEINDYLGELEQGPAKP